MAKKDNTRPKNLDAKIAEKLDEAFDIAEEYFVTKDEAIPNFATDNLNREFIDAFTFRRHQSEISLALSIRMDICFLITR